MSEKFKNYIDLKGLRCPIPVIEVARAIDNLEKGDLLVAHATDDAFSEDIRIWCNHTKHTIVELKHEQNFYIAIIRKE